MSQLDDELKRALEKPANTPRGPGAGKTSSPPSSSFQRNRRIGLLVGLLLMSGAILAVVLAGIDNAAIYSKSVDQLFAERERFRTRNVRVLGRLVSGSLSRRREPCEYRFKLTEGHEELDVHFPQCVIPDTLRDVPGARVDVTVEGRLGADGVFLAHQILAKCPSKYDPKQKGNAAGRMTGSLGASTVLEAPPLNTVPTVR